MLDGVILRDSEIEELPLAGDSQYLRTVRKEPYRVKYTMEPIPGGALTIIGLEDIAP